MATSKIYKLKEDKLLSDSIIYKDGNNYYPITNLIPKVLYSNDSGTTSSVSLSETSDNFNYLEIFIKTNDGEHTSVKIYSPNGKTASLVATHDNGTYVYLKTAIVSISGSSITFNRNTQTRIGNNVATTHGTGNYIYITKVIGYK